LVGFSGLVSFGMGQAMDYMAKSNYLLQRMQETQAAEIRELISLHHAVGGGGLHTPAPHDKV